MASEVIPRRIPSWSVLFAALTMAVLAGREGHAEAARTAESNPVAVAGPGEWVGAVTCATCHKNEFQAWQASHHAMAMQVANEKSVLGNFDQVRFSYARVTSTFFRRDGKFFVNTDGPDGELGDFEILYVFGFTPLQQYLIALPGGRLQAFGIAWDSRPKAQGGERWFHLYPDLKLKAGSPLHWTGIDQNWQYQCAECHVTHFEKNYDVDKRSFDSRWSEINVSCEACHGPGLPHVAWANGPRQPGSDMGLLIALDERRNVHWIPDAKGGRSVRSSPRIGNREIETCARCHSRRGQFSDAFAHGPSFFDSYRPATLDPGLYWPDGQMRDEVYNYGSFLQSRMHASGVTCSDCHEPHAQTLRVPGNGVCGQCHPASKYDGAKHHHHAVTGKGSQCVDCHMRTTTYMQVDARHDHSFRIPRPDLTQKLAIPNACNQCHPTKTAGWAATAIRRWTGRPPAGFQRFAQALHEATSNARPSKQVVESLSAVVGDASHPAIARATALARLADYSSPESIGAARRSLNDQDAMVREAAITTLGRGDPTQRVSLLVPLLQDKVRSVRLAAARALAGAPERLLTTGDQAGFKSALDEYVVALNFNAERPESHAELGTLHADRGQVKVAEQEFRTAIELDPSYFPASINLADLFRTLGREADAEATLRRAVALSPGTAMLHHVLGLSYVRQKRSDEALKELRTATTLEPSNIRFAYVYAIALHDTGKVAEAIAYLKRAMRRSPRIPLLRQALESFESEGTASAKPAR